MPADQRDINVAAMTDDHARIVLLDGCRNSAAATRTPCQTARPSIFADLVEGLRATSRHDTPRVTFALPRRPPVPTGRRSREWPTELRTRHHQSAR